MNTCAELEPLLAPYEWGAADAAERDACERHLAGCSSCLGKYLALKRRREDAAAFDERPAPAVRERLRARVARRAPRRRSLFIAGAAAAAAAAIALALAVRLLAGAPPPRAEPAPLLIDATPTSDDLL